jgi:hypothetical protein
LINPITKKTPANGKKPLAEFILYVKLLLPAGIVEGADPYRQRDLAFILFTFIKATSQSIGGGALDDPEPTQTI